MPKERLLCPECHAPLHISVTTVERAEAYWTNLGLTWWPSTLRTTVTKALYCPTCHWCNDPSQCAWKLERKAEEEEDDIWGPDISDTPLGSTKGASQ